MKRPTTILNRVLLNEGLQVSVAVERDCRCIDSRFEHEGLSFLTITLPSLCDALDQALAQGRLAPSMFNGFKPFKRGGKLPAFLFGFFSRVFELDGSLKDRPCIDSVRAIRQVTRLWKKVELPCSAARISRAYERYRSNDEGIKGEEAGDYSGIRRIAGILWADLQMRSSGAYCSPGVFGSGATAERSKFNERHSVKSWPLRGDSHFPLAFHASHREDDVESFETIRLLSMDEEEPVRVVQVPKTLKTPRTISVEPSYMMLRQQSIAKFLMTYLETNHLGLRSIRFSDQSVNRELARVGSLDGSLATIDLKDASDLVSYDLARAVFSPCPDIWDYLDASRTRSAKMPDGKILTLRKFASMGSATCFPVEAMVFFTIVMYSLARQSGKRPSLKLLRHLAKEVAVYGDDIIVPAKTAPGVMEDLEAFGLKVNHDKSFTSGFFRESCGGDYYKGHDVTPSYLRQWDDSGNIRDSRVLSSYVSLSNQLYVKGLWNASQYMRDYVAKHWGQLPRASYPLGGLHYASACFNTRLRWEPRSSGYVARGAVISVGRRADPVRDIRAGMLLCFQSRYLDDCLSGRAGGNESRVSDDSSFLPVLPGDGQPDGTSRDRGSYGTIQLPSQGNSQDQGVWFVPWLRSQPWDDSGSNLDHLIGRTELDFGASVDSYVSNAKRRWIPTPVGLRF